MAEDRWSCPYCRKNVEELEALKQSIAEYQAELERLLSNHVLFGKDVANDLSRILKKGNE